MKCRKLEQMYFPYISFPYQKNPFPTLPKNISVAPCWGPKGQFPDPPDQKKINQYKYLQNASNDILTWYVLEQREGRTHPIPEDESGNSYWKAEFCSFLAYSNFNYSSSSCLMNDLTLLADCEGNWGHLLLGHGIGEFYNKFPLLFWTYWFWKRPEDGVWFSDGVYYDWYNNEMGTLCIPFENICFASC